MKRIDNTDVWSDGVVHYKKNAQGDFEIVIQETVSIVTLDEPVVLTPCDEHN